MLRQVLEEVVEATAPGVVSLDVDPGVAVVADPLVLDRVVSNLVGNASRYGKPPIRVEATQRYPLHPDRGPGCRPGRP